MNERILAAVSPGEVRVAVEREGVLLDYGIWRPGAPDGVGDIYRGRVTAKLPAMAGCFVSLGAEEGFLPDSRGGAPLLAGDAVTVRVSRAAQGEKGPRLTAVECAGEHPSGLVTRGPGALIELAEQYPAASVLVDDMALAARVKSALGDRVSVSHRVFEAAIDDQVGALTEPVMELADGARLHIQPTSALVAIDLDAGRVVAGRGGKGAAHLAANRRAVPEVARQIRLRNLSGAILVDFAGLAAKGRAVLGPALSVALAEDPVQPRLLGFTTLGLAEIVRSRIHPPLHELLAGPHAAGLAALRQICAGLAAAPYRLPVLRASPAIVSALEDDSEALADLARRAGRPLILRADPRLGVCAWMIEANDA